MDLNSVTAIIMPENRAALPASQPADAFLAGGTWVFSEPQPHLTRLIDLTSLGWPPLTLGPTHLEIAATCTIATLAAFEPPGWPAGPLILQCCRALLGSFKIWNMATVGGNLCLALPAAPMAALATALQAECLVWAPDGGIRHIPAEGFVTGPQQNALRPGEILRTINIPLAALQRRSAFRQISLTPHGRSAALLIGTIAPDTAEFALTVTAATRHPLRMTFPSIPDEAELRTRIESAIPQGLYYDDIHGRLAWRRAMTFHLAEQICAELAA
jgi:CO/xanthine dehydrogenase FAD-binding subunit